MLKDMTIAEFGAVLGSNSPAPGGGSVAALSGMLGANLVSMVCRLTLGKDGYEAHAGAVEAALGKSDALANSLLDRVDLDTEAFNGVMAAFRMPKASDDEKAARTAAIQQGYKSAIQSPLGIARECLQVLEIAEELLGKSNSNALSDLGVAGQQAFAGLEGAIMNVRINIPSIKDQSFAADTGAEIGTLLSRGQELSGRIYNYVSENLV